MIKFREKWFWALCLAVLVHVAVFFIFYMNMNKTDSLDVASSSINKDEPLAINSQDSSVTDKIYTTTLKSTTASDSTDSDSGDSDADADADADRTGTDTSSSTKLTSSSKETSTSTSNGMDDRPKQLLSTAKKTAQANDISTQKNARQNNKLLANQSNENDQPIVINSNETLETFRNNAGLLDIDVPTRQSNVKLDKDYLSAKSEVEAINNQLSSAINEVKKRNQQKIDSRQALRDETIIQNNQNSIESSE